MFNSSDQNAFFERLNLKLWDLRESSPDPVRSFKGPQIHGDAIDFSYGQMLTGSCTLLNGIQIWDVGTGKMIQNLHLANVLSSLEGEYYTCVKYYDSANDSLILAAGRGRCAMDVIDSKDMKILGSVRMKKFVTALDCADYVAFGGHEPVLKIVELPYQYNNFM